MVIVGDVVVEVVVALGVLEDLEDFRETFVCEVPLVGVERLLDLLHVMSTACMAILHMTIPFRFVSHKAVAVPHSK